MDEVGAKHPWLHQTRLPKSGIWYFRRRVPEDVPHYPKKEVKRSLGTSNYREALQLVSAVAAEFDADFSEYRRYGGPPPKDQPAKVSRIPRAAPCPVDAIRYRGEGPPPPDLKSSEGLTDADIRAFAAEAWRDWQGWIVGPVLNIDADWICEHANLLESDRYAGYLLPLQAYKGTFQVGAAGFLERRGYFFDTGGAQGSKLSDYLLRAGSEAYRQRIDRLRGVSTHEHRDRLFDDMPLAARSDANNVPAEHQQHRPDAAKDDREFLFQLQPWLALLASRGMRPRQLHQYESDLRKFSTSLNVIGDIKGEKLQKFYERSFLAIAPNTVIKKFSVIRSYWRYLVSHKLVAKELRPFDNIMLPSKRVIYKKRAWTPAQVCHFWRLSKALSDEPLAQAIRIAAFTGSRIEAVCGISERDVFEAEDGKLAVRFEDKSEAGFRDVPIHSSIEPMIVALRAVASANRGYLIQADTANQFNDRSTGIGKRFSRLKTKEGHPRGLDFHSIRRTTIGLFSKASCPEAVTADIVGHDKPGMTYGVYMDLSDMEEKRRWTETSLVFPDAEFMRG